MAGRATSPDVLVVGSGIVGAAIALRLAQAGHTVTVLSPASGLAATTAAGAMLGAVGETTSEPHNARQRLEIELRVRAAGLWGNWHAAIADAAKAPALHRGTFVVASTGRRRDLPALDAMEAVAHSAGLPLESVAPHDVPGLRPIPGHEPARAAFLPDEGWVDAPAMHKAVLAAAGKTGRVHWVDAAATALIESGGTVSGARTSIGDDVRSSAVVVCAGVGTDELLKSVPAHADVPRVLPAKGVAVALEPPPRLMEPSPFRHAVRTPNREFACGLHVLPSGNGVYLGASNRVTRWPGITGEVTASEILRLVGSATRELFDDFQRWNIARSMYGERPLAVDGLPVVGAASVEGLFIATGTYRNGVLLAPLVADLIAEEINGGAGISQLHPGPQRDADVPTAEEILRAGLTDFAELLRDPEGPPPQPEVGLLLATLGTLALGRTAEADAGREQIRHLLTEIPLVEIVPEAVIELCHPEFLP